MQERYLFEYAVLRVVLKSVTDMAHLAHSSQTSTTSQSSNASQTNPARACANESKKHITGQKGTPFSNCVSAAAKLRGQGGSGTAG